MKPHPFILRLVPVFAVAASLIISAQAQTTFIKANNATSLNNSTSYTNNSSVPTSADTILINATMTGPQGPILGGNMSVSGITVTNPGGVLTIGSGNFLTIGSGGLDLSNATQNLSTNAGIILGANQTWSVTANRSIQFGTNSNFNDNGFSANVTGNGTLDWRAQGGANGTPTYTFSGAISTILSVNAGLTATGATLSLTNDNNAMKTVTISNGRLRVSSIGNIGSTSALGLGTNTVTIGGSASNSWLEYTGNSFTTNRSFQRDARASISEFDVSTAGQTLTINGTMGSGTQVNTGTLGWTFGGAGNFVLNGVISNASGANSTGTTITKTGAGTLTLGGNNSFSGGTQVNVGTLFVNNVAGSGTGSGSVTVASGATLGGTGSISGATTINGTVSPGNGGIGTLNIANTTTWNSNNSWTFELGTAGASMLSPGASDRLNITGSFTKGSGTAFTFDLGGGGQEGWYKLVQWTVGSPSFVNTDFAATNIAGGLTSSFVVDAGTSALYLNLAVPEPATYALLGIGLSALVIFRRRSRA